MNCPRCNVPLTAQQADRFLMQCCFQCGGLFLDGATSKRVVDALDPMAIKASDHAAQHAKANVSTDAIAACPVCQKALDRMPIPAASVAVDVCREHGVWFDRDELHRVVRAVASEPQPQPTPQQPAQNLPPGMAAGQYVAPGWLDESAQKPFGGMPSMGAPVGQQQPQQPQQPGQGQGWTTGQKLAAAGVGVAAVAGVAYFASNSQGFGDIGRSLSKLF